MSADNATPSASYHPHFPESHNNAKKRRRELSPPARKQVRRRRLPSLEIGSLSDAQLATLSEAASILNLPTSALLSLVWDHPKKTQPSVKPPPKRQRRSSSNMSSQKPSKKGSSPSTQGPQLKPYNAYPDPVNHSNSLLEMCSMPSFEFGDLMPKQVADCLASFTPSRPTAILPALNIPNITSTYSDSTPPSMTMFPSSALVAGGHFHLPNINTHDVCSISPSYSQFMCDTLVSESWMTSQIENCEPAGYMTTMSYPENLPFIDGLRSSNSMRNTEDTLSDYPSSFDQEQYSDLIDLGTDTSLESCASGSDESDAKTGPTRRQPFGSSYERQQTAETRKNTACMRCRMQRIRCIADPSDPSGVCLTCKKVLKPKMSRLPCLRYKIADVRLFREGSFAPGHEWSHRFSGKKMVDIKDWVSPKTKRINVTQDYSDAALAFEVREFVPHKGDMLHRQWADGGVIKSVPMPNYAISNMAAAVQAYKNHIVNDGPKFFSSVVKYNDRLLWDTYSTAIDYSNAARTEDERQLLRMVLQLWITVRMCTKSERISGDETLGMSADTMNSSSPMRGKIPIPPVLGAQINYIITQVIQIPLRNKILDLLQKLTLAQKPGNWMCIYFCTFILLHSCSLLTEHDEGYARKHGLKTRHARLDMVKELHHGANVLLAHFHYSCKGFRPFTLSWNPSDSLSMADLDNGQMSFVRQTAIYVNSNETHFRNILDNGEYSNEHYHVAQLYEENWQPRSTV